MKSLGGLAGAFSTLYKAALPAGGGCMSISPTYQPFSFFLSNPKTLKKIKSECMNFVFSLWYYEGTRNIPYRMAFSIFLLFTAYMLIVYLVSSSLLKLYVKYCLWWFDSYLCHPFQKISLLFSIII